MDNLDYSAIGQRIKALRKRKGYNQQELADIIGKSLRTVQKYESGEIEVSIAVVNQLAEVLETTPTFILGYDTDIAPIRSLADVMNFLFHMEQISGLGFSIDVQKPPRSKEWQCAITFNGKAADAEHNADMCLFLEQWEDERNELRNFNSTRKIYKKWQEQTLAYYAANAVKCEEPEELDPETRIKKRNEYLEKAYSSPESE